MSVTVRRAYEPARNEDGLRILVDRYWPRGLRQEDALLDDWKSILAPSPELTAWYGHKPERWEEFTRRYRVELEEESRQAPLQGLLAAARSGPLTLLYGARNRERNNAQVLAAYIREQLGVQGVEPAMSLPQLPPVTSRREPHIHMGLSRDWAWILAAPTLPLLPFAGVYLITSLGAAGWVVVLAALFAISAGTISRTGRMQATTYGDVAQFSPEDRAPWWTAMAELGQAALGMLIACLLLAGLALMLAHVRGFV